MTQSERRNVAIEVKSAAPVQGKYGPQWQVECTLPWSKFPGKLWFDRKPSDKLITPGPYRCILEKGALIKPEYDGKMEWMFNWRGIEFDAPEVFGNDGQVAPDVTHPADPKSPPSVPKYEDQETVRRASIEKQVALKAAVEYAVGIFGYGGPVNVTETATIFYRWLTHGRVEAPGQALEAPSVEETVQTEAQGPPAANVERPGATQVGGIDVNTNLAAVVAQLGWNKPKVKAWLIEGFGSSWSGMTPEQRENAVKRLRNMVAAQARTQSAEGSNGEQDALVI